MLRRTYYSTDANRGHVMAFVCSLHERLELPPHGANEEREVAAVVQVVHKSVEGRDDFVALVH